MRHPLRIIAAPRREIDRELRRAANPVLAFAVAVLALLGVLGARDAGAQDPQQRVTTANGASVAGDSEAHDDWVEVPDDGAISGAVVRPHTANPPAGLAAGGFAVCGERATNPSPEVATIVRRIDQLWGADVRVYQDLAPLPPHAARGGCIFYNSAALTALMGNRLQVHDGQIAGPLLYAILAHEIGHELHHDLDPSRAGVPSRTKELEADRFAGYTMQRLEVPSSGLAPYWSMAGDEFGNGASHGTSGERVSAFQEGWNLAEWNRPESSAATQALSGDSAAPSSQSVAPDEASGAP